MKRKRPRVLRKDVGAVLKLEAMETKKVQAEVVLQ